MRNNDEKNKSEISLFQQMELDGTSPTAKRINKYLTRFCLLLFFLLGLVTVLEKNGIFGPKKKVEIAAISTAPESTKRFGFPTISELKKEESIPAKVEPIKQVKKIKPSKKMTLSKARLSKKRHAKANKKFKRTSRTNVFVSR